MQGRATLRVLLANKESLGPPPWPGQAIETLIATVGAPGKPATRRLIEFLIGADLAVSSADAVFAAWVSSQTANLGPQIQSELNIWVNALHGNGRRRRKPIDKSSIRSYVWVLKDPFTVWAQAYDSLREVTVEDIDDQLNTFTGTKRCAAASALRSLFGTLKSERVIFANPARHARTQSPRSAPLTLEPSERARLLAADRRPDEQLMALLAGVHALRAGSIRRLQIADVNLARNCLNVDGKPRALDTLSADRLVAWLDYRREHWPHTANPHLLINTHTANTLDPIGRGSVSAAFRKLGLTAHRLRVDRFLDEVHNGNPDPVRFAKLFNVGAMTALRYCNDATPSDHRADPGSA